MPSEVARLKGLGEKKEEGIVIRPLYECFDNRGGRWIVKHKRDDFAEVRTPREVDPNKALEKFKADQVSDEF
jgi:hypothetical protein